MNNDTIFALSSGFGKSGVAVIRISGDNLHDFATKLIFPHTGGGRFNRPMYCYLFCRAGIFYRYRHHRNSHAWCNGGNK